MIVGTPKEVMHTEYRVALVPAGVEQLRKAGHTVLVERSAGLGTGISDDEYSNAGAEMVGEAAEVYSRVDLVVKVKDPLPSEYPLVRRCQMIFTYFHFAANEELTRTMLELGPVCIAYETVQLGDGSLPLLTPTSEVAWRMAVQEGEKYLERPTEGRGILLAGVPGVLPAHVVILGAGVVGANAAKIAAGIGANVTLMDINLGRLRYLDDVMPKNVTTLFSNSYTIREKLEEADLLIGAVLLRGARAPVLVTRDMLKLMKPGAVAGTSTYALTNETLSYVLQIADKGFPEAMRENPALKAGLNVAEGKVVLREIADQYGLPYTPGEEVLQ